LRLEGEFSLCVCTGHEGKTKKGGDW
jgi:hypothetical protein